MKEVNGRRSNISFLTLGMRKKIEKMLQEKILVTTIAKELGISRGTIWYERERMGSKDIPYNAEVAHKQAEEARKCHMRNELCVTHKKLVKEVYSHLKGMLKDSKITRLDKELLETCCQLLEKLGISTRIKTVLTIEEKIRILELRKDGITIEGISRVLGRSRSSIELVLNNEELQKPREVVTYEQLSRKYVNKQNEGI